MSSVEVDLADGLRFALQTIRQAQAAELLVAPGDYAAARLHQAAAALADHDERVAAEVACWSAQQRMSGTAGR